MREEVRASVVAEAISWLRTPYHDHGRVKGSGADCAYFPLDVYTSVLQVKWPAPPKYVQQWHLHRNEELYLNYVRSLGLTEVLEEDAQPGDFVLWRVGRVYSHGAIVISWPRIIHAVNPRGVVLADAHSETMLNRTGVTRPLFFTF